MTVPYWVGLEDHEVVNIGGGAINTSSSTFPNTFNLRNSFDVASPSANTRYWTNRLPFAGSPTSFWFSAYVYGSTATAATANQELLSFHDPSNFQRLRIRMSAAIPAAMTVAKVNAAGTATTLANTLGPWTWTPSTSIDKISLHFVNDSSSGSVDIYVNGVKVFNFQGDTTSTAETTTIGYVRMGGWNSAAISWSMFQVLDVDTRARNVAPLFSVSNGNTHNFDVGTPAAGNVNETTLNDATLDGATTAGLIDQYTIGTLPTGTFTIDAFGISARMQKGASGPTKMASGLRIGTTDYWGADQTLTTSWENYQYWWELSPATSAKFTALPVNIGLKSVT